ncbi:MAG: putative 5-nucleotidase [Frankiales bacterium]|nr:putative 5-nucleotidase [Frankiales bacterium]
MTDIRLSLDRRTGDITRAPSASGESALGNPVWQARWEALQQARYGSPVVACMNPGGPPTGLSYASSGGEGDGSYGSRISNADINGVLLDPAGFHRVAANSYWRPVATPSPLPPGDRAHHRARRRRHGWWPTSAPTRR